MTWEFKKFDELTNEELYQVLKLRVDVFVVEQNCAYPELDNQDQAAIHLLVKEIDAVIAYARILEEKGHWHIGRIITVKRFRGKGIGKELMKRCIDYCTKMGITEIHLSAQIHLEDYYKSFGFLTYSKPYDWDGIMHVDMKLGA